MAAFHSGPTGVGGTTFLGDMTEPQNQRSQGTLHEPILTTVLRDVKDIGNKLYYVLLPRARRERCAHLRDWDLWGPLILCLVLATTLWSQAIHNQRKTVFSLVFVLVWLGSAIVTINTSLLGGHASFFQSICILGYCIFPLNIAAFFCQFISDTALLLKCLVLIPALYWATGASAGFMGEVVPSNRKALAMYPVWLFYVTLTLVILFI